MAAQLRFVDKVVIVTGSSSGIGQDAAVEFAKEGAAVVIHGQSTEKLNKTEKLILAVGVPADRILKVIGSLEKPEVAELIIKETLDKFGKIDVLVNNAGAALKPGLSLEDALNLENLDFIFAVNFRRLCTNCYMNNISSVVQLCLLALPHLKKTKGNVLNISSVTSMRISPPLLFYASLKAALDHWGRGFAQMGAPEVRVNTLNPGPIETPIFERNHFPEENHELFEKATLLGRFGETAEMSTIIKFLCSDQEASYVTAANLVADGGMAVKH